MSARTLKPNIDASVVMAKFASDSEIPPTPEEIILTETSSLPNFSKDALIASAVPATSVLMMTLKFS